MDKLSVFEAKARFSEVVKRAEEGKQTVITRRGKAVARVVPEKAARPERWDRSGVISRAAAKPGGGGKSTSSKAAETRAKHYEPWVNQKNGLD